MQSYVPIKYECSLDAEYRHFFSLTENSTSKYWFYLIKKCLTRNTMKNILHSVCTMNWRLQVITRKALQNSLIIKFYCYLVQLNLEKHLNMLRTVTFVPYHSHWNHFRNVSLTVCAKSKQSFFQYSYGPLAAKTRIKLNHG